MSITELHVASPEPVRHHILSVLVENKAGVLAASRAVLPARVQHLLPDRGTTDDERFSRITMVVDVESAPLEQIVNQLDKLINVVTISQLAPTRRRARTAPGDRRVGPAERHR